MREGCVLGAQYADACLALNRRGHCPQYRSSGRDRKVTALLKKQKSFFSKTTDKSTVILYSMIVAGSDGQCARSSSA